MRALANLFDKALLRAIERDISGAQPILRGGGWQPSALALRLQSNQIAADLSGQKLPENTPVVLRVSNRAEDFAVMLGLWLAKLVAVPVHRSSPQSVVDAICQKVSSPFVIDWRIEHQCAQMSIRNSMCRSSYKRSGLDFCTEPVLVDAALIVMTSGSTGSPKGVVLRHEAFAGKLAAIQSMLGISMKDRVLLLLNNTFSFGLWMTFLGILHAKDVLLCERFESDKFFSTLIDGEITFSAVVPTMMRSLSAYWSSEELLAQSAMLRARGKLNLLVIGGESLGSQLSGELRGWIAPARLIDIYGLTETCTCDFFLMPEDYPGHPDSIGKAAPGVRFRILDANAMPCGPLEVGELQIHSPFLMSGYLGDSALSAATLQDGWLRTGDLALSDHNGFVKIMGRSKEVISRGANKITPQEIELALCRCETVAAALVTGIEDPLLGERIAALLIPRPGAMINEESLRLELIHYLERYKHPDTIYIGTELPQGRTGKIDRGVLRALIRKVP
ncbi:MAG: long-chain fatty acid--CoA ligase [Betaproteobacteria bacterium]|nr:long-chain fatty acid--CoA ligase [Betaproteobacteria bacterium]